MAQLSPITVCTLWEGDYHKGVGTLVNSLQRVGYRGRVWAGYRGDLPRWARNGVSDGDTCHLAVAPNLEVVFVKLDISIHFSQYKAEWLRRILLEKEVEAQGVYYFDPDIFILCRWSFFEDWLSYGIAACEDSHYPLNPSHPLVRRWEHYLTTLGKTFLRPPAAYLNSGMLGLQRSHLSFVDEWQEILNAAQHDFNLGSLLRTDTRANLFLNIDQDALTITTCFSNIPVSWVGVDGMAFDRGEWLIFHAYLRKPWRRKVMQDLIRSGEKPDNGSRMYWDFAQGPIQVEPSNRIRLHRWLIPLASFLSRFYRRI